MNTAAQPPFEPSALFDAMERMFDGESLAQIRQIPQEQLDAVLAQACELIEREDFDGALEPLLYGVTMDAYDARFQYGFGLCLQQLGRHEDALKHLGLALLLEPEDADCALRIGECQAAMGQRETAAEFFQTAISLSEPPGDNADIRVAAEEALQRLHA